MTLSFCRFATCKGARFYQSFDGYKVPPKPIGPVEFSQTERLTAFFIARQDEHDCLAWFAKVLVERKGIPGTFTLDSQQQTGSSLYLSVEWNGQCPKPGRVITYDETRGENEYFSGKVGPSGQDGFAELTSRMVVLADIYFYEDGRRLKSRKTLRTDSSAVIWSYDRSGNIVEKSESSQEDVTDSDLGLPAPRPHLAF